MLFKEETVPSMLETGQGLGWRDRKKNPSVLCHAEAMAKCIKASFRSTVWSVWQVSFFFFLVAGQLTVWTEQEHQICKSKKIFVRWRGRVEWAGGMMGHLGFFFFHRHERAFVSQSTAVWGLTVFSKYLQGTYEYLINIPLRLRGNAISKRWLYKASWSHTLCLTV